MLPTAEGHPIHPLLCGSDMTLEEFGKINNLVTDQDWRNYFSNNMHTGRLPVALYSCSTCRTILWDAQLPCPQCGYKGIEHNNPEGVVCQK